MPTETKRLFRPDALRPRLNTFRPADLDNARPKLDAWAKMLKSGAADKKKETELLPGFISDVFESTLGYTRPPSERYTCKREALVKVDGKRADAGFGQFGARSDEFVAVLEGKGSRDPLDRPFAGRKYSAVEQAQKYAVNLQVDWYMVTNIRETRLYHKGHDEYTFEQFETTTLAASDAELKRFVFLLGAERVVPDTGKPHLDGLLEDSAKIGLTLTRDYYREYADLRRAMLQHLHASNPGVSHERLIAATQKILDRVLFMAFCEDRGLLPGDSITKAFQHNDPYNPRPIWENFKGLFRAVDKGNPALKIDAYNGGLFAPEPFVDSELVVPDAVCSGFKKLADYEYGAPQDGTEKFIDVDILGHIFEQSISDLEELHNQANVSGGTTTTKRKREGAFYTPDFITRYLVRETLGPVLRERSESLRQQHEAAAVGSAKRVLEDPERYELEELNNPQREALIRFWEAWVEDLKTVRIVDPACGSGAFLTQAFEQLYAEYRDCRGRLLDLRRGQMTFLDVDRTILTNNLFGVDLNGEAVEIARLSLWIKTAQTGKVLTALDKNVLVGNSLIADRTVHPKALDWRAAFPDVFAAGGFDAVIANPPYVRQEWFSEFKPYLQEHYRAYDGVADLYVYFYELGLNVLRPGGRLGYIVTNKWMKAGYGEPLRKLYGESAWVESVVDLGHNKEVFPDADVFPCILTACKPDTRTAPETARVCVLPREQTQVHDLSEQIATAGVEVPRSRFGADPWNLEPPGVTKLMDKLRAAGVPLKDFAGIGPLYGVKTGCNEAFIVDGVTRDRLIAEHPSSETVLKKYLRGQDVDRWRSVWAGAWMIFARRGIDIDQFPAIKRHLEQFRTQLEPKPKDWTGGNWSGRKPGSYKWYELQDPVDYWREFEKPKLVYQDIAWQPRFCLDTEAMYGNNTVYILPSADLWTLAALNAPVSWWFAWRGAQHGKDEALRFFAEFMVTFPIPKPTDAQRSEVETAVGKLIDLARKQQTGAAAVLDWLQVEFGVEKASQKLQAVTDLDADTLVAEVKKARGKTKPLSVVDLKRLRDEHTASVLPLKVLTRETEQLERRVSDIVNAAFGLTPDEVKLMWDTAPPRMPISPPG